MWARVGRAILNIQSCFRLPKNRSTAALSQPAPTHPYSPGFLVLGQWLLVTLTAGVGGSLLSIGFAAGVALMGQANGKYTFFSHLKWTPVIALGYMVSIFCHLWINASFFNST
jgi:Na+/H+ antiporter NhaD/arsenite permease-like protein